MSSLSSQLPLLPPTRCLRSSDKLIRKESISRTKMIDRPFSCAAKRAPESESSTAPDSSSLKASDSASSTAPESATSTPQRVHR